MAENWSVQVADHFKVVLPSDVAAWLDSEIWKAQTTCGFGEPLSPHEICNSLWGGQMLPDTFPILGNGCGDCLCLRVDQRGGISEVVRWLHEGGLWTPYGATLSEALVLDASCVLRKNSIAETHNDQSDALLLANWALDQFEPETKKRVSLNGYSLNSLLACEIAEPAVRRGLCEERLESGLAKVCMKVGGGGLADDLQVEWPIFAIWLIDAGLIPHRFRGDLARITGLQYEEISRQDWEGATKEAERACELRPEIVWPYAVMGWAAEREGRLDAAAQHYGAGLTKLQTSADFTESWRMSDSGPTSNKFVVERFKVLARSRGENYEENPYCAAALALWNPEDRFGGIRRYWLEQGEMAEAALKYDLAYSCYYNAGWDAFSTDEMPEILSRLVRIARAAGWVALTQLAELHLQSAAAM